MSPPQLDRIRKDGKSELEAQYDMGEILNKYYIEQGEDNPPLTPTYKLQSRADLRQRLADEYDQAAADVETGEHDVKEKERAVKEAKAALKAAQLKLTELKKAKVEARARLPPPSPPKVAPEHIKEKPDGRESPTLPPDNVVSSRMGAEYLDAFRESANSKTVKLPSQPDGGNSATLGEPGIRRSARNKKALKRSLDDDGPDSSKTANKKRRTDPTSSVQGPSKKRSISDSSLSEEDEPRRKSPFKINLKNPLRRSEREQAPSPKDSPSISGATNEPENFIMPSKLKGNTHMGLGKAANAKGKAHPTNDSFTGTPTGMGTSQEYPEDSQLDEPWNCANLQCTSGQTWLPREGNPGYGRKVISNFFGRNKKETNSIHPEVWHNFCRKDYQRNTYKATKAKNKSDEEICEFHLKCMRAQLVRLSLWRPEATFKAQLTAAAKNRMHKYLKELRNNGDNVVLAKDALKMEEKSTKVKKVKEDDVERSGEKEKPLSLEEKFDITLMAELDDLTGEDKTYQDLNGILDWIENKVEKKLIQDMPPIEFLIHPATPGEGVEDPTANFMRWVKTVKE